jgi:hypothetical protein
MIHTSRQRMCLLCCPVEPHIIQSQAAITSAVADGLNFVEAPPLLKGMSFKREDVHFERLLKLKEDMLPAHNLSS